MSSFLISAAHKSSGKTSISIGLCAAYRRKDKHVQSFKKGPDYIDPLWLSSASGRSCYNLDFYNMSNEEIVHAYLRHKIQADITIIEGNKGLYDGLDLKGCNSNAALAKLLQVPVVLVLDARGMTRGIAPLVLGYQSFEPSLNIVGVILNKLGGSRHESKLRAVLEYYTDVNVLGAVHFDENVEINERHLGLVPSNESDIADKLINRLATAVEQQVDMSRLYEVTNLPVTQNSQAEYVTSPLVKFFSQIKIAIPKDEAFGFYYQSDIEAFTQSGVEIVYFNALKDALLPEVDGLFIGGGFPETQMRALSENTALKQAIKLAIENGLPTYAECGGLMYLTESIEWQGNVAKMVGIIPAKTKMNVKPQGRGYVQLQETTNFPWPKSTDNSPLIYAHEFHYSSLVELSADIKFGYKVTRGAGIDGENDGIVMHNLFASYSHLKDVEQNRWVSRFLNFVKIQMQSK
jgi:cobyrinic acid a,c-diamide synthase